jgi:hypothetical protein
VGVGGLSHQRSDEPRDCLLGQDGTCSSADRHIKTYQLLDQCTILLGDVGLDSTRRPISRLDFEACSRANRSIPKTAIIVRDLFQGPSHLLLAQKSRSSLRISKSTTPLSFLRAWHALMVSGRILTREMVVLVHQRAASRIGRQVAHRRRLLRAAKLIEVASRRCSPLGRWISTKLSLKEGRRLRAQSGLRVGLTGDLVKPRFP